MCYAKPGPRCSKHVQIDLDKASVRAKKNPSPENLDNVRKLQLDYDSTPGGRKKLLGQMRGVQTKIARIPRTEENAEKIDAMIIQKLILDERIDAGDIRRERQMEEYNKIHKK